MDNYNKLSYFVNREICDYIYVSIFRHENSGTKLSICGNSTKKIFSPQLDFNFHEILHFVSYDLLIKGKSILFIEFDSNQNDETTINLYYPRETIKIKKKGIFVNNVLKNDCKPYNLVVISAQKYIKKLSYKKIEKELNNIETIPSNAVQNITSNIPVDLKQYEKIKNIFGLKRTNSIGSLLGESCDRLGITGYYSYIREIRKQKLQFGLFFNILDSINAHLSKYQKEIGFNISLDANKDRFNELCKLEQKIKTHEIDLCVLGDFLYKF